MPSTLNELLRHWATVHPADGYTFLSDGEHAELGLTFRELDRRARAIAGELQALGRAGQRVLLLYPPGIDYVAAFFGCLYAGAVAVPAYPPDPTRLGRTLPRLQAIVTDAEAEVALTTPEILSLSEHVFAQAPDLRKLSWLSPGASDAHASAWHPPDIDADSLAFLQYTSGSTGRPKGVMITHGNLVFNERVIEAGCAHDASTMFVGWLPLYHDMGLIGNLLQPLYLGASSVFMSPIAFLQRPLRWLTMISRYRATTSGGPNFAYELCVRKIAAEERAGLDLSSWKIAFCGAEPVRAETIDRFVDAFGPCGFRREAFLPCYGLAEATLMVSASVPGQRPRVRQVDAAALERGEAVVSDAPGSRALVGCGRTLLDQTISVIDPASGAPVPAGRIGEICVSGRSVARGYWRQPELSASVFVERTVGPPLLRTGDLGFLEPDGDLFITGRLKDLIIIRGLNHYPQDIELTVERAHVSLRPGCGAAFAIDEAGEERLAIVQEVDARQAVDGPSVITTIRQAVTEEHQILPHVVVLIRAGSIPKTSSGKIQRHACRAALFGGKLEVVASERAAPPWPILESAMTAKERDVASVAARVLGIAEVDSRQPLTRYGLDSLLAVELSIELERQLGISLPATALLDGATIEQLAAGPIGTGARPEPLRAAELAASELSFGQEALWFLDQLEPGSPIYNVPAALALDGPLDVGLLGEAIDELLTRHTILRARIPSHDGRPTAAIDPPRAGALLVTDLSSLPSTARTDEAVRLAREEESRPFDLAHGPLWRFRLLRLAETEHRLLATFHHAIVDGRSLRLLLEELSALYRGRRGGALAAPPPPIAYGDFARWQRAALTDAKLQPHLDYFREALSPPLPGSLFPSEVGPGERSHRGLVAMRAVAPGTVEALRALSRDENATLFMTCCGALQILLARHTGDESVQFGFPIEGRTHPDARNLVGLFVNTLVLRVHVGGNPTFRELLGRVRQATLGAYRHQELPFEKLVEGLGEARDPDRHPLFEILVNGFTPPTFARFGDAVARLEDEQAPPARFAMTLYLEERPGSLRLKLIYRSDRYSPERAELLLDQLDAVLAQIAEQPGAAIGAYSLVTRATRSRLPDPAVVLPVPRFDPVPALLDGWARRDPAARAIAHDGHDMAYGELAARVHELAAALVAAGLTPGGVVAVTGPRTIGVITAMAGVLASGGVLLTLDPALPARRREQMIREAGARLLVTVGPPDEVAAGLAVIALDAATGRLATLPPATTAAPRFAPDGRAYLFFTSGTTGVPKGVLGTHQGLAHFLAWERGAFEVGPGDRSGQLTGLSFDVVLRDVFLPLTSGATLCLPPAANDLSPERILPWLDAEHVTLLHTVPSLALSWLQAPPPGVTLEALRWVLFAGEPLTDALVRRWRRSFPRGGRLANFYGPTETTLAKCCFVVPEPPERGVQPVGRPLPETQALLFDGLRACGIGELGEIVVRTPFRSLGYLNVPPEGRFVPNPWRRDPDDLLYRTGDRGRYRSDGSLEILGRIDHQVKVRGVRVEPAEVEAALARQPDVHACVVVTHPGARGEPELVAYVVGSAAPVKLRAALALELPEAMVPSRYVALLALPLNANGKVDRAALPAPSEAARTASSTGPRTPTEATLALLWGRLLKLDFVSVDDNFFEIGGHSMVAAQLVARIHESFGVELPLRALFEAPTIAELAERVDALEPTTARDALEPIVPDHAHRHEPFPLNDIQSAYWVGRHGELFTLGNVAAHRYLELEGEGIDLARFEAAWVRLVDRHDMLRAIVHPDGTQQILPSVPRYRIAVTDLRGVADADAQLAEVRRRMSHQILATDQWPLFEVVAHRIDGDRVRLHISFDLLIVDARSFRLHLSELALLYNNPDAVLMPLELSFRDYVLAERALPKTEPYRRAREYWLDRLRDLPPAPELPLARSPESILQPRFVRRSETIERATWEQLKRAAARAGVTPSGLLCAAFSEVLATWSTTARFTLNLTTFHRLPLHPQVNDILGDFTSLTLLAVDATADVPFEERARRLQRRLWEDLEHRLFSGLDVLGELARGRSGAGAGAMPVVFTSALNVHHTTGEDLLTALRARYVYGASQTPQVWLDHQVTEQNGALLIGWDAIDELFPRRMLDDMFGAYCALLERLAGDEQAWQRRSFSLVPGAQLARRGRANATTAPITDELLQSLAFTAAAEHGSSPAVIAPGRTLTHDELSRRALALGTELRGLGARPNKLVAVVMEKGWEQVVAVLGVLASGAAYLPIDPEFPTERLRFLLEHGEVELVVTQPWLDDRLHWPADVRRITVGEGFTEVRDPLPAIQGADDLAYVIFTSGSTGVPKGVMIAHRGAVNTVLDMNRRFCVGSGDRVFALSALNFDLSVYDIFGTLAAGGAVVLPAADEARDPSAWTRRMRETKTTIWNSVPALAQMLVEYVGERVDWWPRSLRLVLLSGDWIPLTLPDQLETCADAALEVVSLGGATEASIWSIVFPIGDVPPGWRSIPYGWPMVNQRFHVLDHALDDRPELVPGQLYIAGVGLARGYWRDDVTSRASFFTHPERDERLYRTGDLGRYLPDGTIEFLGRDDGQVKVQGYRIELGEIEGALAAHPGVRGVAVEAIGKRADAKRLVAYVVPDRAATASDVELRDFLREKLPAYMVPTAFVMLEALPLTANGKIDRKALREVDPTERARAAPTPQSAILQRLGELASSVLGIQGIAPDANLFFLGATSIDMVRLSNLLERELGSRPNFRELLRDPTLASLAAHYEGLAGAPGGAAETGGGMDDELLAEPTERERFKATRHGIRTFGTQGVVLPRPAEDPVSRALAARRTHRHFSPAPVPVERLGMLLSALAARRDGDALRFDYPSAGALYPVQTYLYVKPARVSGLAAAFHYHHPIDNRLHAVASSLTLSRASFGPANHDVFDRAAFALVFVGRMAAIEPMYGAVSRDYCLIEAGAMAELLMIEAPRVGLGLCPIGRIDFERLRAPLGLDARDAFCHALLGGTRDDRAWEEGEIL